MGIDRRNFLKLASRVAAFSALSAAGATQAREKKALSPDALGLLYDGTLCVGCRACIPACKEANGMPPERTPLEQQLGIAGDVWEAPVDLSDKTLNVIKLYKNGSGAHKDEVTDGYAFTKSSCMHCIDASCVSVCPVAAMTKDPKTGIVSYSVEACIGCRYCVAACPFGVPRFSYDTPKPQISKCQLCKHRLAEGGFAACATVCPTGATLFGKVSDLQAEIARRRALPPGSETVFHRGRIDGNDTYVGKVGRYVERIYGAHEIGGTQVLHLSGVPFDLLDKPELPEVPPAQVSETLQHGVYYGMLAPATFLGILVAAARRNMVAAGKDPDALPPSAEKKP